MADPNGAVSSQLATKLPIRVSYDGRITAADAARLLGKSIHTLRHWQVEHYGPPAYWRPLWGSRWSYHLADVYAHILRSGGSGLNVKATPLIG